jgi:putative ABC transport system substrate-binding protein
VDVIVTHGEPNISAAKQATSVIPIVFALATDPIGSGFVASLSRPGGNVTGLSIQSPDLVGKRLELMQEIVPRVRRLAVMADGNPGTILETSAVQAAARTLGLDVVTMNIRRAEEIAPAFDTIKGRVDALYICAVPLVNTNRVHISALALAARLPTVNGFREAVEAEALMSYGPNFPDLFRRTADYVEKILRGGKPADIPVEQPTKYDLVVNLKTAKALGLTIHESFLLRADEVIE